MINGKYTSREISEIIGMNSKNILRVAKRLGIQAEVSGKYHLYTAEDVEKMKSATKLKVKELTKVFYRVSVFNVDLNLWVVKQVCLSRRAACKLVKEYKIQGIKAVAIPHYKRMMK